MPPRVRTSTAYDGARHQLVAFGGIDDRGGPLFATWTFDGITWTRHATPAYPPAPGPMVYDPFDGTVILIANVEDRNRTAAVNQTWVWNGSTWRLQRPRSEITPAGAAVDLVADLDNRTIVALVACCGSGLRSSWQTWTWDGSAWSLRDPATELPGSLDFVTAYDPISHGVIAVGNDGSFGPAATWAWDGRNWTEPKLKSGATFDDLTSEMTTDLQDGTVVLVSTAVGNDGTEIWSGSSWAGTAVLVPAGSPTGDSVAALYYDDTIGEVVLVGGDGAFNEEWMWTSDAWLQLDPTPLSGTAG